MRDEEGWGAVEKYASFTQKSFTFPSLCMSGFHPPLPLNKPLQQLMKQQAFGFWKEKERGGIYRLVWLR